MDENEKLFTGNSVETTYPHNIIEVDVTGTSYDDIPGVIVVVPSSR